MTETEPRRGRGADLRARLELVDEAMLAIAGNVANGRAPGDELERDRCRLVAERIVSKARRLVDLLAKPPADGLEARVVAETNRVLDEARGLATVDRPDHREPGEEP